MNFQFEIDFESEEIRVSVDNSLVAVAFKNDDDELDIKAKPKFEDFRRELLESCRLIQEISNAY
jgi:hypothetical protein